MKRPSFRFWLSLTTLLLVAVLLYLSRHQLDHAWHLVREANLWLLVLIIPLIVAGNIVAGEMTLSYLRQKRLIQHISAWELMRVSMEFNFVNHVLPSGGMSGVSYLNWRLSKLGVAGTQSTVAQAVRFVTGFAAITTLLVVSVLAVTIDSGINRWIILMSSAMVFLMFIATLGVIYLVSSPVRMQRFAGWLATACNKLVRWATRGRKKAVIDSQRLMVMFNDMHRDYVSMMRDKKILLRPYLWGMLFYALDVAQFYIAFLALGVYVNPAAILIGYGIAQLAAFVVVTPGGAGAYEALMVLVLATTGLSEGRAIAGIILARVIILLMVIGLGYIFYQRALITYGKRDSESIGDN